MESFYTGMVLCFCLFLSVSTLFMDIYTLLSLAVSIGASDDADGITQNMGKEISNGLSKPNKYIILLIKIQDMTLTP